MTKLGGGVTRGVRGGGGVPSLHRPSESSRRAARQRLDFCHRGTEAPTAAPLGAPLARFVGNNARPVTAREWHPGAGRRGCEPSGGGGGLRRTSDRARAADEVQAGVRRVAPEAHPKRMLGTEALAGLTRKMASAGGFSGNAVCPWHVQPTD